MRFLRMLTNALLAGAFGAAYLTIIVLQLNPEVPLLSATPWWWFLTLGMLYGVHFAVIFYVILVVREFVAMDPFSPGWVSVRLLAWLGAALSAGAAILMWFNVRGFALALGELAAWRMTAGAVAATASAIVLLAIAAAHYSFGRRGSRVGASLFAIAVIASMALPIAARGRGIAVREHVPWTTRPLVAELSPGAPRVTLLMLDGASLGHLWPRAAEGRLPNFSRLLDGGAAMDLATIRPTQPDPVWTAVATGMYPDGNGVRSAARYYARGDERGINLLAAHSLSHALVHLGFVRNAPLTSAAWAARPLWGILSDQGLASSIVRWPLTHPANPSTGVIVSDRLHQVVDSITEYDRAAHPAWVLPAVQPVIDGESTPASGTADGAGFAAGSPEDIALQRDRLYSHVSRKVREAEASRLSAVRYTGLDTVGHYYLQHAQPEPSRGVPDEERRRFAQVVDRYYAFIDAEIGAALTGMAKDDLLLVVSGFGMEPTGVAKRWLARLSGDADFSGTHEHAPDGFMLAYGTAVQPGRPQRGSIVDVTPTLLYFFGLPIARDMDGFARTDLFVPEFSSTRPVSFVPSYR